MALETTNSGLPSGKSLEEMAIVFGDQIDTGEVLAKHGEEQLATGHEGSVHVNEKHDYA